jgi:ComEC/Rec2-related protein
MARPWPATELRDAPAVLVSDPVTRRYGFEAIVDVGGARGLVTLSAESRSGSTVSPVDLMVGDRILISGREIPISKRTRWHDRQHIRWKGRVTEWMFDASAAGPMAVVNAPRRWLSQGTGPLDAVDRALLHAMTIGDDREIGAAQKDRFRRSGLLHLTVVSGQNLSLCLALLAPLLRGGFRMRAGAIVAVALMYVFLARADPSVCRAAGTACLLAWSSWRGIRTPGIRALGAAIIITCWLEPFIVFSIGFWLSCLASLGLLVLTPVFEAAATQLLADFGSAVRQERRRSGPSALTPVSRASVRGSTPALADIPGGWVLLRLGRIAVRSFAATAAAQMAVAPVIFAIGGPIPLSSLVSNLAVAWAVTFITAGGLVMAIAYGVLGGILPVFATLGFGVLGQCARYVDAVAAAGSAHPVLLVDWWCLPALLVGVGALWRWRQRARGDPPPSDRALSVLGQRSTLRWATVSIPAAAVLGFVAATPFSLGAAEHHRACAVEFHTLIADGAVGADAILADWYRSRVSAIRTVVVTGSTRIAWPAASQIAAARPEVTVAAAGSLFRSGSVPRTVTVASSEPLPVGEFVVGGVVLASDGSSVDASPARCPN